MFSLFEIKTPDDASLIATARASGVKLLIEEYAGGRPVEFSAWYLHFVEYLSANWSQDEPSAQVRGVGATKSWMLAPLSDNEETVDHMIKVLPDIVRRVQATRACFAVVMDLPSRPEGLLIGGAGVNDERILGFMEITRDSEGREHLGNWTPVDEQDVDYFRFASCWLMNILHPPRAFASRFRTSLHNLVGWFG